MKRRPPRTTLFPDTTLFRSRLVLIPHEILHGVPFHVLHDGEQYALARWEMVYAPSAAVWRACRLRPAPEADRSLVLDRKSTRLNSSHAHIPDAVFCLKKK